MATSGAIASRRMLRGHLFLELTSLSRRTNGKTFIFGIDLFHSMASHFTWATWPQGAVHFD